MGLNQSHGREMKLRDKMQPGRFKRVIRQEELLHPDMLVLLHTQSCTTAGFIPRFIQLGFKNNDTLWVFCFFLIMLLKVHMHTTFFDIVMITV